MRRGRLLLAAAAAAAYAVAAWAVEPGFFDGFSPPEPYRWISPPPGVSNPGAPLSGQGQLKVAANGVVDPGTIFTGENQPQASLSVIPGAFDAPGDRSPVTVRIRPVSSYPPLTGLRCSTNVYEITASRPLVKEALVTLRFSDAVPAPSDIYRAPLSGGGWEKIGNSGASAPFYISARTNQLGYFAGCYPSDSGATAPGPRVGGGQTLPIIVAVAILLVVLGGIPLAILSRRGSAAEPEEGDVHSDRQDSGRTG